MHGASLVKPLIFVGSSLEDLKAFPEEVKDDVGYALWLAQNGQKHEDAKPLHGFGGAGVLEIIENDRSDAYQAVYTVKFPEAIYELHAFKKKSTQGIATPGHHLDLIRRRLLDVQNRRAE